MGICAHDALKVRRCQTENGINECEAEIIPTPRRNPIQQGKGKGPLDNGARLPYEKSLSSHNAIMHEPFFKDVTETEGEILWTFYIGKTVKIKRSTSSPIGRR